jgi:hypothetical protein
VGEYAHPTFDIQGNHGRDARATQNTLEFPHLPKSACVDDTEHANNFEDDMPTNKSPDKPETPTDGVPVELIDKLHKANEQLHRAREHLEEAVGAEVNSLAERARASAEIKDAESELEKTEDAVGRELKKTGETEEETESTHL